jgi:hypothetical protein
MKYGTLQQKNECYDEDRIKNLKALYAGGKAYEERVGNFITPSASDPPYVVNLKQQLAKNCHTNHLSCVINFTAGFLFEHPILVSPEDKNVKAPEYYKCFAEDVDGKGTDLNSFIQTAFTNALHQKRAGWRIVTPTVDSDEYMPLTKSTSDSLMESIKLEGFDSEELLDWKFAENGVLEWVKIRKVSQYHSSPFDENLTTHEIYLIYDKSNLYRFDVKWINNFSPTPLTEVPAPEVYEHGFTEVPVILLDIPTGQFLGDQLYAPQIRNIRAEIANQWMLAKTSFAQPVFKCEKSDTAENMFKSKTAIVLGAGDSAEFLEPDSTAMPNVLEAVNSSRDDIYRIGNMNFSNVENKSFAWRSASSKMIDKATGMTMIKNYGTLVREAIEKTYQFISDARNDKIEWAAEGFEKIATTDPGEMLAVAKELPNVYLQPTALREYTIRFANVLIPDLSEEARKRVEEEEPTLGGANGDSEIGVKANQEVEDDSEDSKETEDLD